MVFDNETSTRCIRSKCKRGIQKYYYISLMDQVKLCFRDPKLALAMRYRETAFTQDGVMRDYFDGTLFKDLKSNLESKGTPLNDRDVIVAIYTDGVLVTEKYV